MRKKAVPKELSASSIQEIQMEDMFSKTRIISYLWLIFFPPYGLYRVWNKVSVFRRSEKWVWTMMVVIYLITFLKLIITG
jgi:hypothetical protein